MKKQKCAYCNTKALSQCVECKKPICLIHLVISVDRHCAHVCFRCARRVTKDTRKGGVNDVADQDD